MNHLFVGTTDQPFVKSAEQPFLLFDDGPLCDAFANTFTVQRFNIRWHSFNPLDKSDYLSQCDFIATLTAAFPAGENTLTKEGVPEAFFEALSKKPKTLVDMFTEERPDDPSYTSAQRMVQRILRSPVLRRVLCSPTNFTFEKNVVVKLDRAEIGEFDAFVLASFFVSQHKGQIIVPDFDFYGRDFYRKFVLEKRLTAGVSHLANLSPRLRQAVLSAEHREGHGCTYEDAVVLANYAGLTPTHNNYQEYIADAMR